VLHPTHPEPRHLSAHPEEIPKHLPALLAQRPDLDAQLQLWAIPVDAFEARVRAVLPRHLTDSDPIRQARRRALAWCIAVEEAVNQLVREAETEMRQRLDEVLGPARATHATEIKATATAKIAAAEAQEAQRRLRETRGRLPKEPSARAAKLAIKAAKEARVVELRQQGLTYEGIAETLGVSPGYAWTVVKRSR